MDQTTHRHFVEVDSTNRIAMEMARAGLGAGLVVSADCQRCGRGQYDRSFLSPKGGLYASFVQETTLPVERLAMATLAIGVACGRILEWNGLDRVRLKWPNDLYYGERKIGGILVESTGIGDPGQPQCLVIGVGLNINSTLADFPRELQDTVITLKDVTRREHVLGLMLGQLQVEIPKVLDALGRNPSLVLDLWRPRDFLVGRMVQHVSGERIITGTGLGIDAAGRYIIKDASGFLHRVFSGRLQPYLPIFPKKT